MYQKTNSEIEKKIQKILEGNYEISVLGTNGKDNFPFLSKIIPMYKNKKLYILTYLNKLDFQNQMYH